MFSPAGFGGCTVNLVDKEHAQDFVGKLKDQYHKEYGREAQIYLCRPSRGVHLLGT